MTAQHLPYFALILWHCHFFDIKLLLLFHIHLRFVVSELVPFFIFSSLFLQFIHNSCQSDKQT